MVREAKREDLDSLLKLYLFLHEERIPDHDRHLTETWDCVCVIIPNLTRNVRPYAFIENVVTHADHRGKGYAGECLEYARQIAEKENCYKMMLLTGSKKAGTLHFYEKTGYNSSDKTAFIHWIGMDR